jgi:hypothetical protein
VSPFWTADGHSKRRRYCYPSPSFQCRHYVHTPTNGVCLSGGRHRLVQSYDFILGAFKQPRGSVLSRSIRRGYGMGQARDLQHRSGGSVYLKRIRSTCPLKGDQTEHGWEGASPGQRLCRTFGDLLSMRRSTLKIMKAWELPETGLADIVSSTIKSDHINLLDIRNSVRNSHSSRENA